MSLVEFKKKKNPKNKIVIAIAIILFFMIILTITRTMFGISNKTITANPSKVLDKIDATGLLIKSEKLYNSPTSGGLEPIQEEGKKIAVGKKVANIGTKNQDIVAQLESVEKQIDELGINYYSEEDNANLLEDIQEKISQGNYTDINAYLEDKATSNDKKNLVAENLEALLKKQKELNKLVDESSITIFSEHSGILSYELDGYEEILIARDLENYSYTALDFDKISKNIKKNEGIGDVGGGDPIFKIIDDYIWHLALKIEDERILDFEEGQTYDIKLGHEEWLRGKIVAINLDDSKGVIIIEFKDKLHEYYKNRIMEVSLIKSETSAYEVPSSSILEKDGQAGVYINSIYGIVKFIPVNIIKESEGVTYVERGNNEAYIDIEGKEVRTITQFNEIFLNPSNVEENQILK